MYPGKRLYHATLRRPCSLCLPATHGLQLAAGIGGDISASSCSEQTALKVHHIAQSQSLTFPVSSINIIIACSFNSGAFLSRLSTQLPHTLKATPSLRLLNSMRSQALIRGKLHINMFAKYLCLLGAGLALLPSASSYDAPPAPSATLDAGTIVGKTATPLGSRVTVNQFLGVPFAAKPVRFGMPKPPSKWKYQLETTKQAPSCHQQL